MFNALLLIFYCSISVMAYAAPQIGEDIGGIAGIGGTGGDGGSGGSGPLTAVTTTAGDLASGGAVSTVTGAAQGAVAGIANGDPAGGIEDVTEVLDPLLEGIPV